MKVGLVNTELDVSRCRGPLASTNTSITWEINTPDLRHLHAPPADVVMDVVAVVPHIAFDQINVSHSLQN